MLQLRWDSTLYFKVKKHEIQADKILNLLANTQFWESSIFYCPYIWDFPSFLLALESNKAFIIELAKMWPGGTPDVVDRTSLRSTFFMSTTAPQMERKWY